MSRATPFKKPEEIKVQKNKRVPLSLRIEESLKTKLEDAAQKTPDKLTIAPFVEQILIQYMKYLDQSEGTKERRS